MEPLVLALQQLLQGPSASLVSFPLQAMVEHTFCTSTLFSDMLCIVFAGAAEFGAAAEKVSISAVEMLTRVAAELQPTAQSLLSKGMRPQDVLRMIQVILAARHSSKDCLHALEPWS